MRYWLIAVVLLCLCQTGQSQDRAYEWSVVAMGASQALDIHSSMGGYELNPVLGRGRFGVRQVSIKAAIVGGGLLVQWIALRKHPEHKRKVAFINYSVAGATSIVAIRNYKSYR